MGCFILAVPLQCRGLLGWPERDALGSTDQDPLSQVFDPHDLYTGEQFSKVLSTLTAVNKATEGK